ncbi:alpha/beta fold hydrolase [Colwelliaceae bacterium 6441]
MQSSNIILRRNNVNVAGKGDNILFLAHGFGCDQHMWRFLTPELTKHFTVILFDYVGSGASDISQYDTSRYSRLEGYAEDIIEICRELSLSDAVFVGHSISCSIGAMVAAKEPSFFSKLIMVCPSPCFLNIPPEYMGGFDKENLLELLQLMEKNYIGWAEYLAPLVIGDEESEELIGELSSSFCSVNPLIAKRFAEVTFLSDNRNLFKKVKHPTLIIQSANDALAAISVGEYLARVMRNSELKIIPADGHCLHMTNPEAIVNLIINYAQDIEG